MQKKQRNNATARTSRRWKSRLLYANFYNWRNNFDVLLFADEEDAKSDEPHRIADRLKNMYPKQTVLAVFGPEGGLSRD